MTFQDAVKTCFRKYADFSGRATRPEYWWFFLFYLLGSVVLSILESGLGTGGILGAAFSIALFMPLLAALVRRLHDTHRSGWWALLCLIPIIGPLVLIFFAAQPSA
ncbi:DUF805 domain-containing protein [Dinoroseobacter sp. S375]|uniref:DUF805 domain-containing protein n=1 Tax=Dinoroseobacter sp. S375 TaxID=3415136 RepID=UPI003C7DA651